MASVDAMAPGVVARAFVYFFGLGAGLVLLVPALPGRQLEHPALVGLAAGVALLVSGYTLWRYDETPDVVLRLLPGLGSVLVTLVLLGVVPGNAPAYYLLYLWVVLSGSYFFGPRVATVHLAVAITSSGAAFLVQQVPSGLVIWLVGSSAFAVTGLMLTLLRERADTLILQLGTAARTDALTELPNRRAFDQRLEEELYRARRGGRTMSLLAIDVDGFKSVNDSGGHAHGDAVLRTVARTLSAGRRIDLCARLGGDEFAVLLPDTDAAGAASVAARIQADNERSIAGGTGAAVSIGLASYPDNGEDADALLHAADLALYEAKARGGGRTLGFGAIEA